MRLAASWLHVSPDVRFVRYPVVWHPMKYASMLAENMQQHGTCAWLVNTGKHCHSICYKPCYFTCGTP
jgi:hypothetical protein